MARSFARRRRQWILIAVALVVTVGSLVFVRDVSRQARASTSAQTALNKNFKSLTDSLMSEENDLDAATMAMLNDAATMSRSQLAAALSQLRLSAASVLAASEVLRTPTIAHNAAANQYTVSAARASAITHLLGAIAGPLQLPDAGPSSPASAVVATLQSSNALWATTRTSLRGDPGHVTLSRSHFLLADAPVSDLVNAVVSAPALQVARSVQIAAVAVTPSPLPAPSGRLVLTPASLMTVGVSVMNNDFVRQPVTVTVVVDPSNRLGKYERFQSSGTMAPSGAWSADFDAIAVTPGEVGRLVVNVSGPGVTGIVRTYVLSIAPSPGA